MQAGFAFSRFADRLASLTKLSATDLELLANMPSTIGHFGARHAIRRKDDEIDQCCLLLHGYVCWQATESADGQITSIHVPGDVPDLFTIYDPQIDFNLVTMGPAVVACVPHRFFREASALSPSMMKAMLRLLSADAAVSRNWAVNLGSRDALSRVAHLLCEITTRLQAVGLARDLRLALPFTQSDLASACAISPVHANRTIQELRRCGLLQWQSKTISITDWSGLVRLADFDPGYLRLRQQERELPLASPDPAPGRASSLGTLLS